MEIKNLITSIRLIKREIGKFIAERCDKKYYWHTYFLHQT